ncbi:MAG: hypothetical protein RKH07_03330 [Gammaproteobacteria bacterium]
MHNVASAELNERKILREVVGVFFEGNRLEKAINTLKEAGYGMDRLGVLSHNNADGKKLSQLYGEVSWHSGSSLSPEFKFFEQRSSRESANAFFGGLGVIAMAAISGGIVAAAAALAGPVGAATAGAIVVGLIGAMASTIISESHTQRMQSYLEEGHLLLFVRTEGGRQEDDVRRILADHSAMNTEVVEFRA